MSYDIEVYTKNVHHTDNYTSNIGTMYSRAFAKNKEIIKQYSDKSWCTIKDWKDAVQAEHEVALPILAILVQEMEDNPEEYKSLNPENGWGDYEGAIKFLKDAYKVMLKNKNSRISIDY